MKKKLLACAMAVMAVMAGLGGMAYTSEAASREEIAAIKVAQGSEFRYWRDGSQVKEKLVRFVENATNTKSRDFIPVEDRIAVFDLDGTLVCETTPSYFEWMLYLDRALDDSSFTPSPADKAYARMVKGAIYHIGIPNPIQGTGLENSPNGTGFAPPVNIPKDIDRGQAQSQESVFSGLTLPEYEAYVKKFMQTPAEGMKNLLRGEAFYLPMAEVVSYLHENQFKVFIVSGSDRQLLRILVDGVLPVEADNIIGTDIQYLASHQNGADGLDYLYTQEDEVVRGEFRLKDVKMNKVDNIVREIGKQPVLAFGNSSGDSSMLNYTLANNKYKSLSFALLCDDTERELGSPEKAAKMRSSCEKYGWVPVSMKDDFQTIYGDGVVRADR